LWCGACAVHVDGETVFSCQTALSDVDGKEVTTIEELAPNGDHALTGCGPDTNGLQAGTREGR
jgi:aerobic-type carbon monoxide dehydrogenase small subunit (CoxS/CutS family)